VRICLSGGGSLCLDVDECADEMHNNCSQHADCINTDASFECKCSSGYIGDGITCNGR